MGSEAHDEQRDVSQTASHEPNFDDTPPSVVRLASMIRRARERRGWSQALLAETAHVDTDVIQRIEVGRTDPPFSLVADLVRILDLPIENAVFNQRVARNREANDDS